MPPIPTPTSRSLWTDMNYGAASHTRTADRTDRQPVMRRLSIGETEGMFIEAVPEGAATGPLAAYYSQQRAAWGFLPNYAAAFSTRPDIAHAWNTLNTTVRDGMNRRRFEIATIAAARALRSTY